MYASRLLTPPTTEPVTLDDVKDYLEIVRTDRDHTLTAVLTAARRRVEAETGRQLLTATWQLILDRFPCGANPIYLPRAPLASVSSVKYVDMAGDLQTWNAANYQVSLYHEPARIHPAYSVPWPTTRVQPDAVIVEYVAGVVSRNLVDERAKQAILLICGHWWENREEVVTGTIATKLPLSASYLIEQLRVGEEFTEYAV